MNAEKQCTYRHEDGKRCGNRRWRGLEVCYHHDPAAAEIRSHRQLLRTRSALKALTATEIHDLLARTLAGVEEGRFPVGRAYAVGYLAQLMLGNLDAVRNDFEVAEMQEYHDREAIRRIMETDAGKVLFEAMFGKLTEEEEEEAEEEVETEVEVQG